MALCQIQDIFFKYKIIVILENLNSDLILNFNTLVINYIDKDGVSYNINNSFRNFKSLILLIYFT